jgi:hypothetical protein
MSGQQFLVRGLVLATSSSLLVVAFPVLETVQLAVAGYVLGKLGQQAHFERTNSRALLLGAACLVAGLALAWVLVTLAFQVGGRVDKAPGLRDALLAPGVVLGTLLALWLFRDQCVGDDSAS